MKRIISIIKKDYALALRDSIVLYIIIGPLLLALAVRLFIPTVENPTLNFIVEDSIPLKYISQLEAYGTVEVIQSKEGVINRVNKTDAVPGIILEDNQPKIIFEGNEPQGVIDNYITIFEKVLNQNTEYALSLKTISDRTPMFYGLTTIIIIMTALFLGGTVAGFNIVTEKDTKVIKSMAVTPLKMSTYMFSRGLVAIITSIIIGILSAMILSGTSINYVKLVLTLISSSPLVVIIALLIGRMADNQINSIAAIKVIMPVYLTLPLASLFIPKAFQVLLYPLPNYWTFYSLQHIFLSEGASTKFYIALATLFVLGSVYLLILSKMFRKHFGLR
ncbi:MAG: ABC transporter permease [Thermotaleaceae bacterium]